MGSHFDALAAHLADLHHLNTTYWLLQWDQNTHMPPEGANARAAQMALIQRIRHEMLTSDKTAHLLDAAQAEVDMSDFDSDAASLIRVGRRDYEYAVALSSSFVETYTRATAEAFDVWRLAKAQDDYPAFIPALRRILDLKLQEAELRGYEDHPYDVLLSHWERGLTTRAVRVLFDGHKADLVDLFAAIQANQDKVDDSILYGHFEEAKQRELALWASTALGFDYDAWATFDIAPHPFCLQIAVGDIRLTTRFREDYALGGFFGALHETGHGLHARGFAPALDGTFLSDMEALSHAVCESQSRTWENLVGRSREFWEWAFPKLRATFPEQFAGADAEAVYRAINKPRPGFSRTGADEVSYNLHVMLRFELEIDMVEGKIPLEDIPEAWNAKVKEYFGIVPPTATEGVLQDVHWSMGGIGAFVGYALGNLLSAQYFSRALDDLPETYDDIARGEFGPLRAWLTEHIYQHGRKFTAAELTRRVTGEAIQARDYVAYLRQKYGALYEL